MVKSNKGFTLIELVMIIVILGILAAVAIPKYIDLSKDAADGAARGVLGTLRSANAMIYAKYSVGGTTQYTYTDIVNSANLSGVSAAAAPGTNVFTVTINGNTYTYVLSNQTVQVPTTVATITETNHATW